MQRRTRTAHGAPVDRKAEAGAAFSSLAAPARAAALADPGTLEAIEAGAAVWTGRARVNGHPALLALTDGHQRGGTIGVREAAALSKLMAIAAREAASVIVCWDTGGVRVQEGPLALATASVVGVALARRSISGSRLVAVVSGPRGCFGAPAVIAALGHRSVMVETAHWGLTGPKLLDFGAAAADESAALAATSAAHRRRTRQTDAVVADEPAAIRLQLERFFDEPAATSSPARVVARSVTRTARLLAGLPRPRATAAPAGTAKRPPRDLLRYSFRGQWRPTGPFLHGGMARAAWGTLAGQPAMGLIVGPDRPGGTGLGIAEVHAVTEAARYAVRHSRRHRAPIIIFLFCQSHSSAYEQERAGLHEALAHALKSLVAARMLGHPLLCVMGGGAYGAAYLSLAAPCHRVLAMRGTSVAPMAPPLLAAFRRLRGMRSGPEAPPDLAELIPDVVMVDSVIRLPRAMREALDAAQREAATGAA